LLSGSAGSRRHYDISGGPVIFDLPVTLVFYSIAAGLSLCLSLVLLIFARFQPGTLVIRSWAVGMQVLSAGFFAFGIGPALPRWAIVIGANIALLSAAQIFYSGFSAYCREGRTTPEWWGWALVALTFPAFWYWGLVEPNGHYRGMVFSLAMAAIGGRTALLLGRTALQRARSAPTWAMATLFAMLTAWMAVRFVTLLLDPPPPDLRGANPTLWMTVFGYVLLMSLMSMCVMWMEVNRLVEKQAVGALPAGKLSSFTGFFRNKLFLLWSAVTVLIFCVISALGVGYVNFRDAEKTRLIHTAEMVNDTFAGHTLQVTGQIDTILRSVRGFYLRTRSIAETGTFIRTLDFDRTVIDNIYLIASDGRIIISPDPKTLGPSVTDREYFNFHRTTETDQIFISPVESGRVTDKYHFRISRRMNNSDGSFGGVVLATVNPESFARYYRGLTIGSQNFASLLGIADRKLRARVPEPPVERWSEPVDSPLWEALEKRPSGRYENISQVDNIRRLFVFRKVGALPLVMVTGFTDDDLKQGVRERMSWLVITSLGILFCTLVLALLFTIEAKRRDEQQQAEKELQETNRRLQAATEQAQILAVEAEAASRAKSDFLATMSHEIRTPLSALIGFSELTLSDIGEKRRTEYLQLMNSSANMLRDLVNDILDISRIESGRLELEIIRFDPRASILSNLEIFSRQARQKGLKFVIELPDDLPVSVLGDQVRLRQILTNIVGNAIKFTEKGEVRVAVSFEKSAKNAGEVILLLVVSDTGIGIPPEKQERVFQIFSQVDTSTTRRYGGTGLGTAIAKRLVKLMGGEMSFESEPGVGARFSISLPFTVDESAPPETVAAGQGTGQNPLAMLLVEDNAYNQRLMCDLLSNMGHRVSLAENGERAVKLFEERSFDLVLMDVSMPVMDGYEATRAIRAIEKERHDDRPPVFILAITANARPEDRQACLDSGMDDVMNKPFSLPRFRQILSRFKQTPGFVPQPVTADAGADGRIDERIDGTADERVVDDASDKIPRRLLSSRMVEDFSDDPDALRIYFELLLSDLGAQLAAMEAASDAGDLTALRKAAHTAKGVVLGLRDQEAGIVVEDIGECARSGQPEKVAEKISRLKTIHATLLRAQKKVLRTED